MGASPCVERNREDVNELHTQNEKLTCEVARLKKAIGALTSETGKDLDDVVNQEVAWLNKVIAELWPRISAFVETTLKTSVEPGIQAKLPSALAGAFHFNTVTLGNAPLKFLSIEADPEDYEGRDGTKKDIMLGFDISYHGDAKIDLSVMGASVGIKDIHFEGCLTIELKELLDQPPFISGLSIFFTNTPKISMNWVGATKFLSLLKDTIRNVLREQIEKVCVLPKRIAVVLDKTEPRLFRIKAPRPHGCLHLRLISARNLEGLDWSLTGKATSDPYARIRVSGHEYTSSMKSQTCDPKWDEAFTFAVWNRKQNLVIELYDEDGIACGGDDFLGCLELPVEDVLKECANGPAWFTLQPNEDSEHGKIQGDIQLGATFLTAGLNQQKAKAIQAAADRPQTMMFVGLYSVKVPAGKVGTEYTIEVSCNGETSVVHKASSAPAEEAQLEKLVLARKTKIDKLRSLKVGDEDIAELLDIPVEALKEKEVAAEKYSNMVMVEEPFLWLTDVPQDTVVNITISQNTTTLGSIQVKAASLLEESNCTKRESAKQGDAEFDYLAQVRVMSIS